MALGLWRGQVTFVPESIPLQAQIKAELEVLSQQMELAQIHQLPEIGATRRAYKACGKDPSRYRPSAEALLRRVIQGKGLYQINNLVDALNLLSVQTGFSIGGFDASKISGAVHLGLGHEDEPYAAIGRGQLNIARLPVLRDELGPFGTPTSDSVRTSVTASCQDLLLVIYAFEGDAHLPDALQKADQLFEQFASARSFTHEIISAP